MPYTDWTEPGWIATLFKFHVPIICSACNQIHLCLCLFIFELNSQEILESKNLKDVWIVSFPFLFGSFLLVLCQQNSEREGELSEAVAFIYFYLFIFWCWGWTQGFESIRPAIHNWTASSTLRFEPKAFWIHTCFVHVVIYKSIASQRRKTCFFLYSQFYLLFYSYYCVCWGVAGWDNEVCTYAHMYVKVRGQPQSVPPMELPFVWDRVSHWSITSPNKLGRLTSGVGHLLVTTSTAWTVESRECGGAHLWKQDLNLGPHAWNGNTWQVSLQPFLIFILQIYFISLCSSDWPCDPPVSPLISRITKYLSPCTPLPCFDACNRGPWRECQVWERRRGISQTRWALLYPPIFVWVLGWKLALCYSWEALGFLWNTVHWVSIPLTECLIFQMFPIAPQDQWSHLCFCVYCGQRPVGALAHRRTLLKESTVYRATSKPRMCRVWHVGRWREKFYIRSSFQPFHSNHLSSAHSLAVFWVPRI